MLLCGGAGRRVGGADKPLLEWRGLPLVEHVVARMRPQVGGILISANRNLARYGRYGEVVTDTLPGFAGPLAGILAALAVCRTPWLLACAGDAPALPPDLVARFLAARRRAPAAPAELAVVAHDGIRSQPLPVLLHVTARASLEAYLAGGARSVQGWLARLDVLTADFAGAAAAFRSRNTQADLDDAGQSPICDCR